MGRWQTCIPYNVNSSLPVKYARRSFKDFNEARDVFEKSPSLAALLRLAIQSM